MGGANGTTTTSSMFRRDSDEEWKLQRDRTADGQGSAVKGRRSANSSDDTHRTTPFAIGATRPRHGCAFHQDAVASHPSGHCSKDKTATSTLSACALSTVDTALHRQSSQLDSTRLAWTQLVAAPPIRMPSNSPAKCQPIAHSACCLLRFQSTARIMHTAPLASTRPSLPTAHNAGKST